MSQEEVVQFLKKNRHREKWYSCREIADGLKAEYGAINTNTKKLRWSGMVSFKESSKKYHGGNVPMYVYKWKK